MSGFAMTVTLDDAPARDAIARLMIFGDDEAHAMWDAIGAAMVASTRMRFFATQSSPDGVPWEPSQRFLKHGAPPTLTERGYLRDSNTYNVLGTEGVEWGSPMAYAAIHQAGGTIHHPEHERSIFRKVSKKGELSTRFVRKKDSNFEQSAHVAAYDIHMPARPYLGISAEDEVTIADIATRHLEAALLGVSP